MSDFEPSAPTDRSDAAASHVLLVIDHIWLSSVISDLLTICVSDITVHEAGSRTEALALAREVTFKAIVLDANLSGDAVPGLIDALSAAAPAAHLVVLEETQAALAEYADRPRLTAIRKEDTAQCLPALILQAIGDSPAPSAGQ